MRRSLKRACIAMVRCRFVLMLVIAAMSVMWAASVCSAGKGQIDVAGYVYSVMELIINDSLIEWDGLKLGDNICPHQPTYTVLSNVPFEVTIRSQNPHMRVTDSGPMQGAMLKHPLKWRAEESGEFTPLQMDPVRVISGDVSSHDIIRSLTFALEIDLMDQPSIDSTQRYKTEIILSLEPVVG